MKRKIKRRDFFTLSTATAVPFIIPSRALGRNGHVPPSDRINMAAIGIGNRNRKNIEFFLKEKDVQFKAVSDCFADRRMAGKNIIDDYYNNKDCKTTRFHEEIFQRKDIDGVLIATGDRWHAVLSALAARAGKDVYCEKPFTLTVEEGWKIVELMKRFGTVWQCGTQRRSVDSFRFVAEAVKKGMIGNLQTITAYLGGKKKNVPFPAPEPVPNPEEFDYDRWLGQAPWAPYSRTRVSKWRERWDTSGGQIVDMGPHYFDISQWAHDSELSGPVEYEGKAQWQNNGFSQMPFDFEVVARYSDGVKIIIKQGTEKHIYFKGDEGWIKITDYGVITAEPKSILSARGEFSKTAWYEMSGHIRNFLDAVRSRNLTAAYPELSQRTHIICHCANISLRLGRKLKWDNKKNCFINDKDANNLLSRTMRVPWYI